jgi:hypothetical protein
MSDYKPGTLAMIRDKATPDAREWRAVKDDKGWFGTDPGMGWVPDALVTHIRPLVVLDLDKVSPSGNGHGGSVAYCIENHAADQCELVKRVADQIREQHVPRRIPEPGLWGVVSAHVNGKHGPQATYKWAHAPWGWEAIGSTQATRKWEDLIDPVLIREGVES